MRWYLFILTLLAFSCSSDYLVVTEDKLTAEIFYVKDSYKPFTGKCKVVYNHSSVVKEQFTFKKGILDGEAIAWYRNGNLRRKGTYSNGHLSGKWIFWDEEGHRTVEANYKLNSLHGIYISLYTNGRIKEKGHFIDNRQTGKWLYYDENGLLMYSSLK